MKKLTLFMIMVFLAVLPLAAQEEDTVDTILGTYIQTAASGTFAEESDGMYLMLEGVPESMLWSISAPTFRGGMYETLSFVGDWSFAEEDLSATAILTTENESVLLSLGMPEYDPEAGTVTYMVTIEEITPFDEDAKDAVAPEAFETATLFINIDNDFFSALRDGMTARVNSARSVNASSCATDPYCDD